MQENEKIHVLPMKARGFSFLNIVDKFVCILLSIALLNYYLLLTLQIVRNLVFNILFVGVANSSKHSKGAVSVPLFVLNFFTVINII